MTLKNIVGTSLLAGAALVTGCGYSKPPPFDPVRLQQMQVEPARSEPMQELPPLPSALEPATDGQGQPSTRPYLRPATRYGREVPMTLQEAIHRMVINSLEVRVAGYQAGIDEARILEAEARFDPLVFLEGQAQRSYPQGIGAGSLDPLAVPTQTLEGGLRQNLTTGGQMELKYSVARTSKLDRPIAIPGQPDGAFFQNDLTLSLTQPLLRDFGSAANMARITIARND